MNSKAFKIAKSNPSQAKGQQFTVCKVIRRMPVLREKSNDIDGFHGDVIKIYKIARFYEFSLTQG